MKPKLMRELRIRGIILELLKSDPQGFVDITDLQGRIYLFGYALLIEEILPHIRYLADRGYVRIEKKYGGSIIHIYITSKGDDLVRCVIDEDPGVLIPRCERPGEQ